MRGISARYLRKTILGLITLWGVLVALWPTVSDRIENTQRPELGSGEALYKSSLTKAGFGLLGVHFYESRDGRRHWEIKSDFAELHRKDNYAFLRQVRADFYAQNTGNVVFTQSDSGRSWFRRGLVELEGNVSIRSARGYLFSMNRLNYHSKSHEFDSEDPVTMRGPDLDDPGMYLTGVGLTADIDSERFQLKKDVQARRRLNGNDWLKIQSRRGEFYTNEQRAVFLGRARAQMRGLGIASDTLELTMSQDQEAILGRGKVRLKNRERIGYADMALIELATSRIILTGDARIESKNNEVRGKKIYLYADDDRIEVEGAQGRLEQ